MVVPFKAPIGEVLCVLQYKLQVGLTHSTIKVYLASISACHLGYGDNVSPSIDDYFHEGCEACQDDL